MVTVADTEVGIVQFPRRKLETESAAENALVVVTLTYFLGEPPPGQDVPHVAGGVWPAVHSQNTLLVAVTPVRPVAFCAVVLVPDAPGAKCRLGIGCRSSRLPGHPAA